MRWLALDVGSRTVGVAICDDGERVATALRAVRFGDAAALSAAVARLAAELGVEGVVVGVPTTRGGTGRGERRVAEVIEALRRAMTLPVVGVDERGTTREAERLLAEAGVPKRRWPELIDSLAAQVILEAHLAARRGG